MGIDNESNINRSPEAVHSFDKLPEGDREDKWIQFDMNLMKVKDFRVLNSVINLCLFEIDKENISQARKDWIQRVMAAAMSKLQGMEGNLEDPSLKDIEKKTTHNV